MMVRMNITTTRPTLKINILRVLTLLLIAVTLYTLNSFKQAGTTYDEVSSIIAKQSQIAGVAEIHGKTLTIPTYDLFKTGHIWSLVSKKHPLKGEAGFTLVSIPVAHGDSDKSMKVAQDIAVPLQSMINTAKADGEELMVSSAYRSLVDQKKTYDDYVTRLGVTAANQYVSPVGASEHHTGLAVDMSSVSDLCGADSDSCSLGESGAAWLAKNAATFGFIQRYPQGDQAITGVYYEPWHYRYVGTIMAKFMQDSGLTYDQVIDEIAPGYAKN